MASAALYTDNLNTTVNCTGARPRRILEAHGTCDPTIPIDGRKPTKGRKDDYLTPNIAQWASRWAERNGCDPDKDRTIELMTWGNKTSYSCNGANNLLQQYRIGDLGHCWASLVGNTDSAEHADLCTAPTMDYTQAVMEFFAAK